MHPSAIMTCGYIYIHNVLFRALGGLKMALFIYVYTSNYSDTTPHNLILTQTNRVSFLHIQPHVCICIYMHIQVYYVAL